MGSFWKGFRRTMGIFPKRPILRHFDADTCQMLYEEERDLATEALRENEALRAMVDACREVVADNDGQFDGDRPIDFITDIVGYPEK